MYDVLIICLLVLAAGACIGSFLNVVALRAISKESIVLPSSKCPECNTPIKWYDNIPVFSYFFTFKGKCRSCGCKVSMQYPIVEALTSILFLVVFLAFGPSIQTLLLLFLICISIVIIITDFKTECIYDAHIWVFIAAAVLYSVFFKYGIENAFEVCIGLLAGALIMEAVARLSYYLIKKKTEDLQENDNTEKSDTSEQNCECASESTEEIAEADKEEEKDIDINEYVQKNKRAFGEGDTYLAAGAGALLGWKYFLVAVAAAIILQAVCILPQFIMNLYKQKEYRLLVSLSSFIVIAVLYWILNNILTLNIFIVFAFVIALIFFAADTIGRLKRSVNNQGFSAIPFGPALLFSVFTVMFFGQYIVLFLKKYIFMILG